MNVIPGSEPDADHDGVPREQHPLVHHAVLAHVVDGIDGLVCLIDHGDDDAVVRAGVALQFAAAEAVSPALGTVIGDLRDTEKYVLAMYLISILKMTLKVCR